MALHTIIGSGGVIGNELAKELILHKESLRLVSRNPKAFGNAELIAANATDPTSMLQAVQGSAVIYVCIGLKYDYSIWREQWPKIMDNLIEACKRTGARMIFFDNVYMYGKSKGAMTEDSPYEPVSRKGDLRARMDTQLMSAVRKGEITATIARAADFYGPGADKGSIINMLVLARLARHKKAQWLGNASRVHSFTYTPDAARSLYVLAKDENSWNQVWHLPTAAPALTGKEWVELAAAELGVRPGVTVLSSWMVLLAGIFNKEVREIKEMLYQYEYDYLFDSTKFEKAYGYIPVSYREGIAATAKTFRSATGTIEK